MPSFFEKLKKGMGIEESVIEVPEEKPIEKKVIKRVRKVRAKKMLEQANVNLSLEELPETKPEVKKLEIKAIPVEKEKPETTEKIEKPETKEPSPVFPSEPEKKWFEAEGQLAIDVYQTDNFLVIQSAIAGVRPENLEITMEKDVLSIKGVREKPFEEEGDYFSQECYWGSFSREVILPAEVDPNQTKAEMKDGILTIKIPKISREKKRVIVIKEN